MNEYIVMLLAQRRSVELHKQAADWRLVQERSSAGDGAAGGRADDGSGYGVPAAYRANLADLERIAHRSLIDGIDSPACAGIPDGYPVSDSHNMN